MNRLGLLHPQTLAGRSNNGLRELHEAFSNPASTQWTLTYPHTLEETGAVIGAPAILIHNPELARAFLDFRRAIYRLPELTSRLAAIARLTVAVCDGADYEIFALKYAAKAKALLTDAEMVDLLARRCPRGFDDAEKVAHTAAKELCSHSGSLFSILWTAAIDTLGEDTTVALIHNIAFQRYVTTILNGFDARAPSEAESLKMEFG